MKFIYNNKLLFKISETTKIIIIYYLISNIIKILIENNQKYEINLYIVLGILFLDIIINSTYRYYKRNKVNESKN